MDPTSPLPPLYEGKAKIIYSGPDDGTLIQYFKDDATAFNAQKKDVITGKGVLNNFISEHIMAALADAGVTTHFIRRMNAREQLIRKLEIIPVEIVVRNVAAGSICPRLGLTEGDTLPETLVEYCLKDDALGDPIIAREHILTFGWASAEEFDIITAETLRINSLLQTLFSGIDVRLIDFKLEFGRPVDGSGGADASGGVDDSGGIMLADEISPDNCRLWQVGTDEKMDKDRFRRDLGGLTEAYQEIARRLGVSIPDF
ncbi:MAG: phosphoribosylaminoimidazolesuccinocarboxamide synthase [Bacteroidetes bacterium]|nr:phosphoribosylaminoimidazolesuccinocarboxamide synthase [Bacteroidota bacterium]